jgi:hypothetical protein
MPATEAMPASVPRPRGAHRRDEGLEGGGESHHVGLQERPKDGDVLGVLGERADGDAGVGDDDVGDAEARA